MAFFKIFNLTILFIYVLNISEDEINQTVDDQVITYGSTLKIQNVMTKF